MKSKIHDTSASEQAKQYRLKTTRMSKKIVLLFVLISNYAFSQSVNDYQYVVVPEKFSAFKDDNKFNLNTNVKLLLRKYDFEAFLASEALPFEVANANCNKLHADLVKESGLLTTKLKVVLKDCREQVVYETAFGKSNEKDLAKAYNQALREAGKSFDKLNYKYNEKNGVAIETPIANHEVSIEQTNGQTLTPVAAADQEEFYFAQPIANGYQVVDTEPKVIMKLLNTSQKNVFIGIKGDINGTVISKNGQWFFEYYQEGKLVSELLKLKF